MTPAFQGFQDLFIEKKKKMRVSNVKSTTTAWLYSFDCSRNEEFIHVFLLVHYEIMVTSEKPVSILVY